MRKVPLHKGKKSEKLELTEMTALTGIGLPKRGYVLTISNSWHGEPPATVGHMALERAVGFIVRSGADIVW